MEVLATNSASLANQPNATRDRFQIRREILLLRDAVKRNKAEHPSELLPMNPLLKEIDGLKKYTDGAPFWVVVLIALSLGLGTTIGWKRIVVTIGEKIGKFHLTYAQGASAEIVAASTISASTLRGLPWVSTLPVCLNMSGTLFLLFDFQDAISIRLVPAQPWTVPTELRTFPLSWAAEPVQHWGLFNMAPTKKPQLSFNRGSFSILSLSSPTSREPIFAQGTSIDTDLPCMDRSCRSPSIQLAPGSASLASRRACPSAIVQLLHPSA